MVQVSKKNVRFVAVTLSTFDKYCLMRNLTNIPSQSINQILYEETRSKQQISDESARLMCGLNSQQLHEG